MKYFFKHIHVITLFITVLLYFSSCSTPIINKGAKQYSVTIEHDNIAKLYWKFDNAEYVTINNSDKKYHIEDSCFVSPMSSSMYIITASSPYKNDNSIIWYVKVKDDFSEKENNTFDTDNNVIENEDETYQKGSTYSTIPDNAISNEINSIDILGTTFHALTDSTKKFNIRFLALDYVDEYITGINIDANNIDVNNMNIVENIETKSEREIIEELNYNQISQNLKIKEIINDKKINFCIALDNSAAAIYNSKILSDISLASKIFTPSDNYYFSIFNQNFGGIKKIELEEFNNNFMDIPFADGFCALNKSVGKAINYLVDNTNKNEDKVMIIITSSADNASILYDENDLLELAKSTNTIVYVIAVGISTPTYNLANLATGSGGKLFLITKDSISTIPTHLAQIINGTKRYYNVNMNAAVDNKKNDYDIFLTIYRTMLESFRDTFNIPLKKEKMYSEFQVLAAYNARETKLDKEFEPAVKNLADVLIQNPKLVVELVGHSGYEGNDRNSKKLALTRVQQIRRHLISAGANPAQIRLTSEGAATPLYQNPTEKWQTKYNNRVDVRWLLPENEPFEIIAEYTHSEDIAQSITENWEEIGEKAYYQRIMKDNLPAYRVLIWGYKTEKIAKTAARKLSNQYNRKFMLK